MKSLITYIYEALDQKIQKWLKDVYNNQQQLVKDNKVQPIEVDIEKLNKPEKEFLYDNYSNDPVFKKILADKHLGFTVTNQMFRIPKQYLIDNDKEYKPDCYPYWYQSDQNIYFVGLCLYDKNITYIENYINLIGIESSLIVNNSGDLNKAILNDFIKIIPKLGNYKGITIKPIHPKMKATFIKLGFRSSSENKEILVYKI